MQVREGGNGSDESGGYSITYHLNGGTNNGANPSSYTKNDEFPLRAPSKEGQVFDGWFGNSEFSGEAVTKIAKGTTDSAFTFAQFKPDTFVSYLHFCDDNGSTKTIALEKPASKSASRFRVKNRSEKRLCKIDTR
ncbi:InlB B-repeat-containing protein [Treponema pectinovorum]|uniref:InlB B-repeat-containing protein n=1 Tax=Treponema pectinovorum TaxID=164 RepID=UPI003D90252B